jgi:hypothetical protein
MLSKQKSSKAVGGRRSKKFYFKFLAETNYDQVFIGLEVHCLEL